MTVQEVKTVQGKLLDEGVFLWPRESLTARIPRCSQASGLHLLTIPAPARLPGSAVPSPLPLTPTPTFTPYPSDSPHLHPAQEPLFPQEQNV